MSEDEFVAVVTEGQTVAPAVLRVRGRRATARPRAARRERAAAPARRSTTCSPAARAGAVLLDTRSPESTSRRATCAGRSTSGSRAVRRVRRRRDPPRPADRAARRRRAASPRRRCASPASASTRVVGAVADSRPSSPTAPSWSSVAPRLPAHELARWLADDAEAPGGRRAQPRRGRGVGHVPGAVHPAAAAARPPRRARPATGRPSSTARAATGRRSPPARCAAHGFATVADLLGGYGAWTTADRASVVGRIGT